MQADEVGEEAELTASEKDPRACPEPDCDGESFIRGGFRTYRGAYHRYRVCKVCGKTWTTAENPKFPFNSPYIENGID